MFNTGGFSFVEMLLLMTVELITFIYLIRKYKKVTFYILIIFIFYQAPFNFLGRDVNNFYKIFTLVFTLWYSIHKNAFSIFKKGDSLILLSFTGFSLFYFYAVFHNNDNFTLIFSQYSRYLIILCLWFLMRKELYHPKFELLNFQSFMYELFLIQIIITIAKLVIFKGQQLEGIVGSMSINGGSLGTNIPIVGFIMIWMKKNGKFERNDWLFVLGLMLIGFAAGKRAIWFILPLVIAAFMIYIPKLKLNKTLILGILLAPLAFYAGVRLTPTLNPEKKVWGSFDYDYAMGYADKYQFGDDKKNTKKAQGRGGATNLVINKWKSVVPLSERDWIGNGLSIIYYGDYESFDKSKLGVESKGNATGLFQTYITTGFLGVFATLILFFTIFWQVKMKRLRWVLFAIIGWEYFLYIGNFFRTPVLMFMMIYFIHYSNYLRIKPKKVISG